MVSLEDIKLPPHNLEAEKWALCGVLLENEIIYVYDWLALHADDFYQKEHRDIYAAMQSLRAARKTIDVVTLGDQLAKDGVLDTLWGTDYLYELSTFLLSASSCAEYTKIVKEKSVLRWILKVSQHIIGDVYEQREAPEILETIEKRIFDLTQMKVGDSLHHIKDILSKRIEEYMDVVDNPEKAEAKKILSHYRGIDDMLWGFKPGELIILAARPSMWKTAFAINVLTNIAVKQRKSVAIFSLEMGSEQIVDRILSTIAEVPMYKITKWNLDSEDFWKLGEAMEVLGDSHIYIDDKWSANINMLRSKLRRLKIEKGALDLVVIDYLQLMHGSSFVGNRVQEISEISRNLKELARELEVPIMALSQLSRAVEQRIDKKPQLSDLRESWAIEQDADSVLMLHREDYYDSDTDRKGATDVCIRKNRNGAVWEVELFFQANIMKFMEVGEHRDNTY
jgi:replicative DNA helicase